MATAKRLPSGSYRAQVFDYKDDSGKRHYKSFTANTKKEAEYIAAEYALDKKDRSVNEALIFQDAMRNYIENRSSVLSPSTIRGYNMIYNTLKSEFSKFMEKDIYKINQIDIQILINEDSRSRTPKTVKNHHGLISAVLAIYRPEFTLKTSLPQKIRTELYIPTDEDITKLMESVKDTELEIPIMLGAFAAMRRGEICALSIDDINDNIIHVKYSLVMDSAGRFIKKSPKTFSSNRFVEVPHFVIDKIRKRGYITTLNPSNLSMTFSRTIKKNHLPQFRFHDLRHYSASIQHSLGIPDAYIMKMGGWGSDAVLKNIYRHVMSDRSKSMSDIAINHFENIMQHEIQHEKEKPQ